MSTTCLRCDAEHGSNVAVFACSACKVEICDSCKNEHRCNEVWCGYCDEFTNHTTQNCVLPIVN